ncbi:serine/threonine-protein kinase [Streptomyces sp. NPDC088785]|uniref:serine/threonine-protein kinase n=1 Tax=Streptomyces sp. NPDC088785 TaxID=3365897 RepID=UPI0038051063
MTRETQPGRVIGARYRLDEALARGGFGIVWKARDLHLGLDVAVKELYMPPATSPKEHAARLARAEREPRNAAKLRDEPYIVAVHDVVFEDDKPWMIMRLVLGHSLLQQVESHGRLPLERAVHAAGNLLAALRAAHAAEIIHRDVKPANVMVAATGDFLLTDFGIAVHASDTSLTTTGGFIGSLEYVAPERVNGVDDRPVSDLFSLGATLYHAVEGVSPFRRNTQTATLSAVLIEQPAPPAHAGALKPLITALLEKDPDRRPTAEEALALLNRPPKKKKTKEEEGAGGGTGGDKKKGGADGGKGGGGANKGSGGGGGGGGGGDKKPEKKAPAKKKDSTDGELWWAVIAVVVLAVIFWPEISDKLEKDDAKPSASPSASSGLWPTSTASAPFTPEPATAEPEPSMDPACTTAADALSSYLDLMPNPVTNDNLGSAHAALQDLASRLDRAASEATDSDVRSAINALSADARVLDGTLDDSGNGFESARDELSSDDSRLVSTCNGD